MKKVFYLVILCLAILNISLITANAESISIETASTEVHYNGQDAVFIDSSLNVSGDSITGAKVIINNLKSGDTLSYTGALPSGTSHSWDASKGILSFSGTQNGATWQTLLRTVTFSGSQAGQREITFSLGSAVPDESTGHFYEYISGGFNWTSAKANAESRSLYGLQGYLATISSLDENNFIREKLGADAWIGSSDDYQYINIATGATTYANQSAAEGNWYWVTGPEAGTHFSIGNAKNGGSPVTVSGQFSYWNSGEPNDSGDNEHYGEIYSSGATGRWNDLSNFSSLGYVVEYGGMSGDPTVVLQSSRTLITPPSAPYNLSASASDSKATVSFAAPSNNGGSEITGYIVTSSPGNITAGGLSTSIEVTGLNNGTNYTFAVTAVNAAGETTSSNSNSVYVTGQYHVTYYSTGEDSGSVPVDNNTYYYNDEVTILGNGSLEKAGYSLTWNTQSNGEGSDYEENNKFVIIDGIALYAKWEINDYTITFEENGGTTVNDITQTYASIVAEPTSPSRSGYTFDGWYSNSGLTSTYTFTTMPAMNTTAYAKWKANKYTIDFEENGGSTISAIIQDYKSSVSKPADPTKEGYSFVGWYSDSELTTVYTFDTMPLDGITLYAKWEINDYTITFEENGGTTVNNITQTYASIVAEPTSPSRSGYTFDGWYSNSSLTSTYTFTTMPAMNTTAYAKWNANEYTIDFEENGGTTVTAIVQDYETSVTKPADPTKEGYSFVGWYSNIELTTAYTFETMPLDGITLYAKWEINEYNVTFNNSAGEELKTEVVAYGNTATPPEEPLKSGYSFIGWSESYSFVKSDLILTPLYKKKQSSSSSTTVPSTTSLQADIEDGSESIGEVETVYESGDKILELQIESNLLADSVNELDGNEEHIIVVPIADETPNVKMTLDVSDISLLSEKNLSMQISTPVIEYEIPIKDINQIILNESNDTSESDILETKILVNIKEVSKEKLIAEMNDEGVEIIGDAYDFSIITQQKQSSGETIEKYISRFSKMVPREVKVKTEIDLKEISTGVIHMKNGQIAHVPTFLYKVDGTIKAKINSFSNSVYSVIKHFVDVPTATGHWSEAVVDEMASRLVISEPEIFEPEKIVTREEFADYLVRSVGLYNEDSILKNEFIDVSDSDKYALSIAIAKENGIFEGYGDGYFGVGDSLTREQAMTTVIRVCDLISMEYIYKGEIDSFNDFEKVSLWASEAVEKAIDNDIIQGRPNKIIDPQNTLTHAEAIKIIHNILVKNELINDATIE